MTQLRQFVDLVTDSTLPKAFQQTRIKLTLFVFVFLSLVLVLSGINISETTRMGFEADRQKIRQEERVGRPLPLDIQRRNQDEVRRSENFQRVQNTILVNNIILLGILMVCTWIALSYLLLPLAKSIKEKERFLTNTSHELRTPLAILYSELSLSRDIKDLKTLKKVHEEALIEIKRLQHLSDTLLGKRVEEKTLVNTSNYIKNAWKSLQPLNINNIKLELKGDSEFIVKPVNFQQLIYHLVENAIKHASPAGSTLFIKIDNRQKTIRFSNSCKQENYEIGTGLSTCKDLAIKTGFDLNIEQKEDVFLVELKLTQNIHLPFSSLNTV